MVNFPLQSSRANFCAYLELIQFTFLIQSFDVKKQKTCIPRMLYLSNKQVVNMKVILPLNQIITRHFVLLKIVNLQP